MNQAMIAVLIGGMLATAGLAQAPATRWQVVPASADNGRIQITIDAQARPEPVAVDSLPSRTVVPPDGGLIQGTLISKGRFYAVTETGMAQVGDPIGRCRIASVSLDRVVLADGPRSFELDVRAGTWSVRESAVAGE